MHASKALRLAHLIKAFAEAMTTPGEDTRRAFNDRCDAYFEHHPEENLARLADSIARAIALPSEIQAPTDPEVYGRVLPDLIELRTHQDTRHALKNVS